MKIFFTFILLSLVRCTNDKRAICRKSDTIRSKMPPLQYPHELYPAGELHYLYDTVGDKKFGNFFSFNENSCLESYAFKVDGSNATYIESYDPKYNGTPELVGTPIVYKTIDFDRNPDSVYIEYLISNFSWEGIDFELTENDSSFFKIPIKPHKKFAFILSAEYSKGIKGLPKVFILTRFKAKMRGTHIYKSFFDTIDLKRRNQTKIL
jgi:hypothetical protein